MTKDELVEVMKIARADDERRTGSDLKKWALPVLAGVTIAFVGWFANKSSADIENVTNINNTLEFMRQQREATDEQLSDDLKDLKNAFETSVEKINERLDKQFTREDFNREMIYRDQDMSRIQNQVGEIFNKLNER